LKKNCPNLEPKGKRSRKWPFLGPKKTGAKESEKVDAWGRNKKKKNIGRQQKLEDHQGKARSNPIIKKKKGDKKKIARQKRKGRMNNVKG